jgi:molybdopterin/thiamine biosynthesis adenylyltransferase
VADRQRCLPGFSQEALASARILLIGAGGLGSAIAPALCRKGAGEIHIVDYDTVQVSNLNRQAFSAGDLFESKSICLACNSAREGYLGSVVTGHEVAFTPDTAARLICGIHLHLAVVGVDNNAARALASQCFRQHAIPTVFTAVDQQATWGWCFIQEVSGPCLACLYPWMTDAEVRPKPCPPSPGVIDILRVVGGLALYGVDALLMPGRPRHWNFHSVNLVGDLTDITERIPPRPGCVVCALLNQEEGSP